MTEEKRIALAIAACKVRMGVVAATHGAKAGHPGGSLSAADLFAYLYNEEMQIDPANPKDDNRDRFVLSKGHTAPGLYAALANRGFFPVADLPTLRHIGSYLQGHPNMNTVPGVDMSTGSLGQGVSVAAGMAKGLKYLGKPQRVYTLLGDGEIEEGECWEAFLFAAQYKLDHLCVIVDINGLQIDGATQDVMNTAPRDAKLMDFGFDVHSVDGHSFAELELAFDAFHKNEDGASHQCCEDFALMRSIPGMTVLCPADDVEARAAVKAAYALDGPVYLRFGRLALPVFHDEATFEFQIGKGEQLTEGDDIAILATGLMVNEALQAAETLKAEGVAARVINLCTIKPLDEEIVLQAAKECGRIITCEEHSVIGGLGEAVAAVLGENLPTPLKRIGVNDEFGHSGPAWDLLKQFGLCAENIACVAREMCSK